MQAAVVSAIEFRRAPSPSPSNWDLHGLLDGLTGPDAELARCSAVVLISASLAFPDSVRCFERTLVAYLGGCRDGATRRCIGRALAALR